MAINDLYNSARERLLRAQLDWESLDLQMAAYSGDADGFDPTHSNQSHITDTLLAMSQPILDPTILTGGYARSSAAYFTSIPIGPDVDYFVLLEAGATPSDRALIGFFSDVNNMPFTPNGGGYVFKPDFLHSSAWFRA